MTSGPARAPDQAARPASKLGDLGPRIASGVVMIALAIVTLLMGGVVFVGFWLLAALAVHWEWQRMTGGPHEWSRMVGGGAAIAGATALTVAGQSDAALLVLALAAGLVALLQRGPTRFWNAAGVLYAGALVLSVTVLRLSILSGFEAILWLFAIVWGTDVMAYFGGRLIGGPKLWARVSPSKTWAGFLTGVVSGALLGLLVLSFFAVQLYVLPVLLLGLAAGAVAQGGDLFESSVKRRFGVKDSSRLIPGHGGAMDRLDGFIAAAAFAAIFGARHAGVSAAAHGLFTW